MRDGDSAQKPRKHHYLPIFYLKRWSKEAIDGKLVEFSRPYGPLVKPRRVAPAETGFLDLLYTTRGLPPERAQWIEEEFMKPVDTFAAEALALLEAGEPEIDRSVRHRSSWSLFLMSLMMRMPNDLLALRQSHAQRWQASLPKLAAKLAMITGMAIDQAETNVQAMLAQRMDQWAMELLPNLVDHNGIGQTLNNMHWFTVEMRSEKPEIFTSDQPLLIGPYGLASHNAYVCIPIGPNRLFWAVRNRAAERELRDRDTAKSIQLINELVVGNAHHRSYATTDAPLDFMQEWLAKHPHISWFKRLADKWAVDKGL